MSQTMLAENGAATTAPEPAPQPDGTRTYRGETLEELLPQIRTELGPDAVVLRQREGLAGGVAGFFQKRCVEVDARPGVPRVDLYDEPRDEGDWDEPEAAGLVRNDAATREGFATDGVRKLVDQAQPFAALLDELAPALAPEPTAPPTPSVTLETKHVQNVTPDADAAPRPAPKSAATLRAALTNAGIGDDLAAGIVDDVVASRLPFATPGRLRTLVRDELALRLPIAPAPAPGPRSLAIVGPAGSGKTAAVAAIATAHAAAGDEVVALTISPADGGAALTALLAGSGVEAVVLDRAAPDPALAERLARGLVVVDTPPAWSGGPDVEKLARQLRKLGVGEVHLALRAGSGRHAAAELIDGLARLRPDRLLLTAAGETAHLGGAADAAIRSGLALGYVADGPGALAPADPRALAARIVT
jgi:flagellar biosynthesis GTPase FlhF